jgi:heterotetrameric sarcosine oxidase gamma subunit
VSDLMLTPRSALDRVLVPGHYGAEGDAPSERTDQALATVMARKGQSAELSARVKALFAVELPMTPKCAATGQVQFIWAGPGRWLAAAPNQSPSTFEGDLRQAFSGLASVTGQSDGRSIIRISGAKAREALAKGVPLDLDPRVFGPGDTAMTLVAHINVHLWQSDAAPTYDFAVFRSFAASFCEWLLDAAAEFGIEVLARGSSVEPRMSST